MTEDRKKDMVMGCFVGLAVGDAYGTTYEFKNRAQMPSEETLHNSLVGGGPFNLNPGDWTDDTSMALCLAESIIEKGWHPRDKMKRYINWWQTGYNSVKGECFDIGSATRNALGWFNMTQGREFIKDTDASGNGVLMRLAPIPMMLHGEINAILATCTEESTHTHPSPQSIETSMLMGAIIDKILSGERDKRIILNFNTLLDENAKDYFNQISAKYGCGKNEKINQIKGVLYANSPDSVISGDGYCVYSLEAALWAFINTDSFVSGLKKVVALGSDTDTTGAIYGQIAGAYYGLSAIPWRDKLTWSDKIHNLAEQLYEQNKERRNGLTTN